MSWSRVICRCSARRARRGYAGQASRGFSPRQGHDARTEVPSQPISSARAIRGLLVIAFAFKRHLSRGLRPRFGQTRPLPSAGFLERSATAPSEPIKAGGVEPSGKRCPERSDQTTGPELTDTELASVRARLRRQARNESSLAKGIPVAFRSNMMRDDDPYGLRSWEQYDLIDDHLVVSPARSSLECVIYFDPRRRESLDFDRIEERCRRRPRAAPSRVPVRAIDREKHGELVAVPDCRGRTRLPAPRLWPSARRAFIRHLASAASVGSPEKNRTLNLNYDAFYGLAAKLNATLRAIQDIRPAGTLPAWLRRDPAEILQPVCGCLPRNGDDKLGIPLTRQGDLWLGCDDFKRSQVIFPAVAATPATAVTKGREVRVRWYGLSQEKMRAQIRRELTDCLDNDVDGFDLRPSLCSCARTS